MNKCITLMQESFALSSAYFCDLHTPLVACRTLNLSKMCTVKPFFSDESAEHWLDEYDGDPMCDGDIIAFATDKIFTTELSNFHETLGALQPSCDTLKSIFDLFDLSPNSAYAAARAALVIGTTTKIECQAIAILAELADKPVKLKRVFTNIYDQTDAAVWSKLHKTITKIRSIFGGKKTKIG